MIGAFPSSVTNAATGGGGLVPQLQGSHNHKRNKYVGQVQNQFPPVAGSSHNVAQDPGYATLK
jgi:hypothetical protein